MVMNEELAIEIAAFVITGLLAIGIGCAVGLLTRKWWWKKWGGPR